MPSASEKKTQNPKPMTHQRCEFLFRINTYDTNIHTHAHGNNKKESGITKRERSEGREKERTKEREREKREGATTLPCFSSSPSLSSYFFFSHPPTQTDFRLLCFYFAQSEKEFLVFTKRGHCVERKKSFRGRTTRGGVFVAASGLSLPSHPPPPSIVTPSRSSHSLRSALSVACSTSEASEGDGAGSSCRCC